MSDPNTMAQQRPPFFQRPSPSPHGFSPSLSPAQPPNGVNYPLPAQPSIPPHYTQLPVNKRPRLSPGAQSPYGSPSFSVMPEMGVGSPVNGIPANGVTASPAPPGSMGPPSRPVDKATDIRTLEDPLAGTGVNIDDEERNLTATAYPSFGHSTPNSSFLSHSTSFGTSSTSESLDRPSSAGRQDSISSYGPNGYQVQSSTDQLTTEEIERRKENQADWQAARHRQHALWQMFLQGDPLERLLNQKCYEHGIKSPKDGLYYATKGIDRPPQRTRVVGLDGASQIIDQGQTILSTQSGDTLGDLMKLISLAAKDRMTGIVDLSGRLAQERRDHSDGRVPTGWKSVAAVPTATSPGPERASSPVSAPSLKRTHSQANGDVDGTDVAATPHRIVEVFRRISQADRAAEEARLAKRARRNASTNPDASRSGSISLPGGPDVPSPLLTESDKRPTKKDRKLAESKFTEAQQHKSANETARMATSGLLGGKFFGNKKKTYSWMSGGTNTPKAVTSPSQTPGKSTLAADTSAVATPGGARAPTIPKGKQLGQWDEEKDPGLRARDVLLVLETDGKAPRSLLRGYNDPKSGE